MNSQEEKNNIFIKQLKSIDEKLDNLIFFHKKIYKKSFKFKKIYIKNKKNKNLIKNLKKEIQNKDIQIENDMQYIDYINNYSNEKENKLCKIIEQLNDEYLDLKENLIK
jgi:hypothetical protein